MSQLAQMHTNSIVRTQKQDEKYLWSEGQAEFYQPEYYGRGLTAMVMRKSHQLIEKAFGPDTHFNEVLEVGAGSGIHISFVRHSFDKYVMTDSSDAMLKQLEVVRDGYGRPTLTVAKENAAHLSFPDASFNRLVATHVLEHIMRPQDVVDEWLRVLRPHGTLSIVLPCDPGLLWRFGRLFGPRWRAKRRGIDYDYIMAIEHINSINNLVQIIRHHSESRREYWWPSRIHFGDINLIYAVNITK